MPSWKQIEANRRNAQKSTGPRSVEGKAVARFNALKTGINAKSQVIPGEDSHELETLAAEYHTQFQPATALERFLVDALVSADWQLRRLRRIEAQLWTIEIENARKSYRGLNEDAPLGQIVSHGASQVFTLLQRRIDSAERSFYRALAQLRKPIAPAAVPPADPEPVEDTPLPPELGSFSPIPPMPETPPPAPAPVPQPGAAPHP